MGSIFLFPLQTSINQITLFDKHAKKMYFQLNFYIQAKERLSYLLVSEGYSQIFRQKQYHHILL